MRPVKKLETVGRSIESVDNFSREKSIVYPSNENFCSERERERTREKTYSSLYCYLHKIRSNVRGLLTLLADVVSIHHCECFVHEILLRIPCCYSWTRYIQVRGVDDDSTNSMLRRMRRSMTDRCFRPDETDMVKLKEKYLRKSNDEFQGACFSSYDFLTMS